MVINQLIPDTEEETLAPGQRGSDTETDSQPKNAGMIERINNVLLRFSRVPASQKIFFVQHLSVMTKAGISLAKALQTLSQQTNNKRLKRVLADVAHRVEKGQTLAESLGKYRGVFSQLFINMIAAGEVSGKLEDVLKQLYVQMKKDHELVAKIRGALIYPAVIFLAMVGIGTAMMIFVVPKLLEIFRGVDIELPLITRILIAVSDTITNYGAFVALGVIAIAIVWWRTLKLYTGRYWWQWFVLKLPIISPIVKKINLARFARTMSSLLQTDIKIVESFTITAQTLTNLHYRESLIAAGEQVKKGEEINKVLAHYPHLYSHVILQMVSVGEETGELDNILSELASFYEEEVAEIMETLPSVIEPLIILVLAVAIGTMAVAIVMPMYALTEAF